MSELKCNARPQCAAPHQDAKVQEAEQQTRGNSERIRWWQRVDPALSWTLSIYLIARVDDAHRSKINMPSLP